MTAKPTLPKQPALPPASPPLPKQPTLPRSPAKTLQEQSKQPAPQGEQRYSVTLRDDKTFEYHLDLAQSVIDAILDPDVPDAFIEVQCPVRGTRRFVHTSYIKEIDVRGMAS